MRCATGWHPGRAGVRLQGAAGKDSPAFRFQVISSVQHPCLCALHKHTNHHCPESDLRSFTAYHALNSPIPDVLRVSACMRCRARPRLIQRMWTRIWERRVHWATHCCAAWPYLGRSVSSSTQASLLEPFWSHHDLRSVAWQVFVLPLFEVVGACQAPLFIWASQA